MKKIIITLFLMAVFSFISFNAFSNEITHAIGDTGYMIREAMHEKAYITDYKKYKLAIKLQKEAKQYLHGTHKNGRSVSKAMALTKQAYALAKQARDSALVQKKYW